MYSSGYEATGTRPTGHESQMEGNIMARKLPAGYVPMEPEYGEPCEDAKRLAEAIQALIDADVDPLDFYHKHVKTLVDFPGVVEYDRKGSVWRFTDGSTVHTWATFGFPIGLVVHGPVLRMVPIPLPQKRG